MYRSSFHSVLFIAACGGFLGACGYSDNEESDLMEQYAGVAMDGYLNNATVCVDLNNNKACESNEPDTVTGEQGDGIFNIEATQRQLRNNSICVIAVAGVTSDMDNGELIKDGYTLCAPPRSEVVSPITSLVLFLMDQGMNHSRAVREVQVALGISLDPYIDYIEDSSAEAQWMRRVAQVLTRIVALETSELNENPRTEGLSGQVQYSSVYSAIYEQLGTIVDEIAIADSVLTADDLAASMDVLDSQKLMLGTPPSISLQGEATMNILFNATFDDPGATATDIEDGNLDSAILTAGGDFDTGVPGSYSVNYTVTDTDGNSASAIRQVNVAENSTPVISLQGGDVTLAVGEAFNDPGAAAYDLEDSSLAIATEGEVDIQSAGTYVLTYSVTDSGGATASVNRTVVVDSLPSIRLLGATEIVLEPNASYIEPGYSASDVEDGDLTARVVVDGVIDTSNLGAQSRTYRVSDSAGNQVSAVRQVYVVDDGPEISLIGTSPMDIIWGANFQELDPGASAMDLLDGNLSASIQVAGGNFDTRLPGTYVVTYSVTDSDGNSASVNRTVNVAENSAPTIALVGGAMSLQPGETFSDPGATAEDLEDTNLTIETTGSVDTSVPATYTLTYSVTDSGGASASVDRTVTVASNDAPQISLLGDASMYLLHGAEFNDPGATATDAEDGNLDGSISLSGTVDTSISGTHILTYRVTDSDGNSASVSRTVNVANNRVPTITLAGAAEIVLRVGGSYSEPGYSASDLEDGELTSSVQISGVPDTGTAGVYPITYTVTDSGGATASGERTIIVDGAPAISLTGSSEISLQVNESYVEPGYSATDNEDGDLTASVLVTGTVDTATEGSYNLSYSVSDSSGNSTTVARVVTVENTNNSPQISLLGEASMELLFNDTFDDPGATATDVEDGILDTSIMVTGNNFDTSLPGSYSITYTVTDSDGNSSSVQRIVTVLTNQIPVISLIGDSTVVLEPGASYIDQGATAEDPEEGGLQVDVDDSDVDTGNAGTYEVVYTATDSLGASSQAYRTVIVENPGENYAVSWESEFNLPAQDANGWSILAPSANSRLIYVSNSGNDSTGEVYFPDDPEIGSDPYNPAGPINAFATVEAAYSVAQNNSPDYVLLERGGEWTISSPIDIKPGLDINNRSVLAYYGNHSSRPVVKTGTGSALRFHNGTNSAVIGIKFVAQRRNPDSSDFVGFSSAGNPMGFEGLNGPENRFTGGILIEDCWFDWFKENVIQPYGGGKRITDVIIRRNLITNHYTNGEGGAFSQGFYAFQTSSLVEENLFDHNGWYQQQKTVNGNDASDGQARQFNHATYFPHVTNTILRGNIFMRSAGSQSKITVDSGGSNNISASNILFDNNLYLEGEIGIEIQGNDDVDDGARFGNIHVVNNVMMHVGRTRPTNRNLAWGLWMDDWSGGVVSDNIFTTYGGDPGVGNVWAMQATGHTSNVDYTGNIAYRVESNGPLIRFYDYHNHNGVEALYGDLDIHRDISFTGNEIQNTGSGPLVLLSGLSDQVYGNNAYDSASASPFQIDNAFRSFSQYQSLVGDWSSSNTLPDYVDADRTIETYLAEVKGTSTDMNTLAALLKQQSKFNWDSGLTAEGINGYIRNGFCFQYVSGCR